MCGVQPSRPQLICFRTSPPSEPQMALDPQRAKLWSVAAARQVLSTEHVCSSYLAWLKVVFVVVLRRLGVNAKRTSASEKR